MKLLYLSFYFTPDQCPGAFRNTDLVRELARQLGSDSHVHVLTTQPNRYASYRPHAADVETWREAGCLVTIERIDLPTHSNGFIDQALTFLTYYRSVRQRIDQETYNVVFASSSRLFTAFLGAQIARKFTVPLLLDIRDLFREAILDVLTRRRTWLPGGGWLIARMLSPLLYAVERYTFGYASLINLVSAGFHPYFAAYPSATYSFFTNGIDEPFLNQPTTSTLNSVKTILYAGNIGDGQGLQHIIPQAAQLLGTGYRFVLIGDGGARQQLESAVERAGVTNVELYQPINRNKLIDAYRAADYLFIHLNDLNACRRVLPSKLFEYGATDKPILAGVAGYAAEFITEYIPNALIFPPGNAEKLVNALHETPYKSQVRSNFRQQFCRTAISQNMAALMLQTVDKQQLVAK